MLCARFNARRTVCQQIYQGLRTTSRYARTIQTYAIVYDDFGDPAKVLKGKEFSIDRPASGQVLTKLLASPVNPADINMIQGVYPVRPQSFPAVGGNESVSEVVEVAEGVHSLKVGDWVLPAQSGSGTWQTFKVMNEFDLVKVSNEIPKVSAATLTVNPRTAYRMLMDFEKLHAGNTVIQNGANSGVGQAVIQIAAKLGLQTINIVRDRPDLNKLVDSLKSFGASHVVTSEMLKTEEVKSLIKSLPKPKLALNCVGGKASADLLKYLCKGGTMVTYGGMSKQPLMIPAGPLIFNDVKVRGFWVTQWTKENSKSPANREMNDFLTNMIKEGELKAPIHRTVEIKKFMSAIEKSMEPFVSEKQILVM